MPDYQHKDILGNDIKVGDSCVYPVHNILKIGFVSKLNPKMLDIKTGKGYFTRKYPHDVYVINDPKLSVYLLKNSK